MGQLVFQATLGGQVNLVGPNTASTYNINVPTVSGNMVTTGDTGTVTNTMLAGSIANNKLTNSSVTIGSTNVALGATSTTLDGVNIGATTPGTGAFSTLAASNNVTFSGGTANGVAYLNGSKVVTSGSALTFDGTNLGVGNSAPTNYFSTARQLVLANTGGDTGLTIATTALGSANIFFANSTSGTGQYNGYIQYNHNSNNLIFATSATEGMRLTSTGLGIGTSSPGDKLQVGSGNSSVKIGANGANNFQIYNGALTQDGTNYAFAQNYTGQNTSVNAASGGQILLQIASNTKATLDSSGNLGLGVTPSAWLSTTKVMQLGQSAVLFGRTASNQVQFGSNFYIDTGALTKYINTDYASKYVQDSGQHQWFYAASGTAGNAITFTQAMTLDASGSLGIGVTTIPEALTVKPNGTGANLGLNLVNNASNLSGILFSTNAAPATSYTYIKGDGRSTGFITLSTNDTERMRIDSSGNLLVNTTSVSTWGGRVSIQQDSSGGFYPLAINNTASGSTSYAIQDFYRAGTRTGTITNTNTATAYNTSSDYRLKNITGPVTNSGAYIDSLNPVEGTWKADGSVFVGLLAHEAQAVSRTPVATGEKDGEEMQSMSYSSSEMIANMIAELKSLRARVAQLESKGA